MDVESDAFCRRHRLVIALVLLAAPFFLSTQESLRTANSAVAAGAFVANIFLQMTTGGYFDAAVDQMPLLHLWSLSVEEQLYLLWPALLLIIPRRHLVPAIVGLGLSSFALSEWLIATNPQVAFYQMPARFWELAAGGLIAAIPMRAMPWYAIPTGVIVVIATSALPLSHFPGVGALPAVIGSCLIIAGVHGRWHQPLSRQSTDGRSWPCVLLALLVARSIAHLLQSEYRWRGLVGRQTSALFGCAGNGRAHVPVRRETFSQDPVEAAKGRGCWSGGLARLGAIRRNARL